MSEPDPRVERIVDVLKSLPVRDMEEVGGELDGLRLREAARAIISALASQHVATILTAEDQATAIYQALMPLLAGIPIEPTSRAIITHLAVMVDQTAPGMGEARKAATQVGEGIWNLIIAMRQSQIKKREEAQGF